MLQDHRILSPKLKKAKIRGVQKKSKQKYIKTSLPVLPRPISSPGSRILDLALQIPTVLSRVVLHLAGRVHDPAPSIIHPIRTDRVGPTEVLVNPGQSRRSRHPKPAQGEEPGREDQEESSDRDPYRARYEEERGEEDEAEDCGCYGNAGEEEEYGSGDD